MDRRLLGGRARRPAEPVGGGGPPRRAARAGRGDRRTRHPEHGPIRQVGHTYAFDGIANPPIRPRRLEPITTGDVLASSPGPDGDTDAAHPLPAAPLEGVVVLHFGLAIAGPFGTQILAHHRTTVIKVTSLDLDLTDAIYVGSSRG